jgi:hypothetical protein
VSGHAEFTIGLTKIIERGLIDPDEWDRIKRGVAQDVHNSIMAANPRADEDAQVKWNYKANWRTTKLPKDGVFGSDYDYWNDVVNDAFQLWHQHAGQITADFIADVIAKQPEAQWSKRFYAAGFGVWERGVEKNRSTKFEGPVVDVGPTADFAVFLERWNYSKTSNTGKVPIYHEIGVMNFIARKLALDWKGVHTVYLMPIRPKDLSSVRKTPHRNTPVITLPIIRIAPRHYRKI